MEKKELTEEEAIALYDAECWKDMTAEQRAKFQLHTSRLCMLFDIFQQAVEETLKRSVWTHEFADPKPLIEEMNGQRRSPTFQEVMNLIPAEKRVFVVMK